MLNQNFESVPGVFKPSWMESIFSYPLKNYVSNKISTTSKNITQYLIKTNTINYKDEDKTIKEINYNNSSLMNNPSLSNKSDSNINIQQIKEKKPIIRADDYREKIARHILNDYYYNKVNKIIKGIIRKKFKKIPKDIPNKAARKKNKHFLVMTLKKIYETKELYNSEQKEKTFEYNLNVIKKLRKDCYKDFREKSGFNDILEMTFRDLVVQYLKSEEYKKNINLLKGKEREYYIFFAEHFIEHYDT